MLNLNLTKIHFHPLTLLLLLFQLSSLNFKFFQFKSFVQFRYNSEEKTVLAIYFSEFSQRFLFSSKFITHFYQKKVGVNLGKGSLRLFCWVLYIFFF